VTGAVVVGTGFGCFTHVPALRAAGFEVHALVGRDPAKTARRAEAVGVARACTSYAEALALPGVAAVTIATPPHTHAPLVLHALAAGKNVLCEKPFARDASEACTLLAAAQDAGVTHLLGTEFRYDTGQALLARAVHDGVVGDPRLALFLLHVPVLADRDASVPTWWADAIEGGGWLGAHGSQVIDQIRVTLGEFDVVTASLLHLARATTADDGFVVHFRLKSGVAGVMQSTAADRGPFLIETRVVGTRGTAWIDGLGDAVWVADARGTRRLGIPDELRTAPTRPAAPRALLTTTYEQMIGHGLDLGPYTRLAEHFRARIERTAPPPGPAPATFADGVADMAVLDAMRRSTSEKRTVTIERFA
jgi:predicted dehydrogenase